MRILNLFAGLGGNRLPWGNNNEHDITAIEYNTAIDYFYHKRFPNDNVIVTSAWEYLEDHFHEFDMIWASPPCQTHCRFTTCNAGVRYKGRVKNIRVPRVPVPLPDLKLYSLILFLSHHFRGKYVVENVIPFYKPLIKPDSQVGRYYFWSNVLIPPRTLDTPPIIQGDHEKLEDYKVRLSTVYKVEIPSFDVKGQLLRNMIHPEIASYIWKCINKKPQKTLF